VILETKYKLYADVVKLWRIKGKQFIDGKNGDSKL